MANFPLSDERAWTLDERIRLTMRCYPVANHTLGTHWRATGNDRGGAYCVEKLWESIAKAQIQQQ